MAAKPITMDQIRIIIQQARIGASIRSIARSTGISRNTVRAYVRQIQQSGHTYDQVLELDDVQLSLICRQYDTVPDAPRDSRAFTLKQWIQEHGSDLHKPHVTRQILWEEYRQSHPDGYGYTWFCRHLNDYVGHNELTAILTHPPGHTVMFDFAGDTLSYEDPETGLSVQVPVWVGVLPSSSHMYVQAARSQQQEEVAALIQQSFSYFGGVPQSALFDNFRSVVKRADRYEPTFTELMDALSVHYQCTFMTTRVKRPRDKASVESAVNVAYKRIYGKLRNQRFTSLEQLNQAITHALDELNKRPFKGRSESRLELFERYEKPVLSALPPSAFVVRRRSQVKVQRNYHVILGQDMHQYSVPWRYAGKSVRISWTSADVEIYYGLNRIAVHPRNPRRFGYSTVVEHMPPNHQAMLEYRGWDATYFLEKASTIGPATHHAIGVILASKSFPEQTYKSCLGVLKLGHKYTSERLESVCELLLELPRITYQLVKTMLENNRDLHQRHHLHEDSITPNHSNIRGRHTYL